MRKIEFTIGGSLMRAHDAAILIGDEDPLTALTEQVVETISTDVEVTCGGITMHLAAWRDPDHWEEDWAEQDLTPDRVHELVAGEIKEDS